MMANRQTERKSLFEIFHDLDQIRQRAANQRESLNPYKPGVLLWDIGKKSSPRCDTAKRAVSSGAILFAYMIFIEKLNKTEKSLPMSLKMKVDSFK